MSVYKVVQIGPNENFLSGWKRKPGDVFEWHDKSGILIVVDEKTNFMLSKWGDTTVIHTESTDHAKVHQVTVSKIV